MPLDQVTRILAIRHGETDWNVDTRIQGQIDIPLNSTGRAQASRLALALSDESLDAVYASDLARAWDTADIVGRRLGLRVQADPSLRERAFGCFEGQTHAQIEQRWPHDCQRWRGRDPTFGPEGGETLQSFHDRCLSTLQRLASAHRGQTIAVVAHGGVLDCYYRAAMGLDLSMPRTWKIGNATINRLLGTADGLTLLGWADSRHLDLVLDERSDGDTSWAAHGLNARDSKA